MKKYGPMDHLMTMLKLIPEQYPEKRNPLFQLAIEPSLTIPGNTSAATAFIANT
jgi:hypothetical protein